MHFLTSIFQQSWKKHFHALPVRKSMQGLWWMQSQDTAIPPLPLPSPLNMQLSHNLCLFTGWDVQAVPGQGSSWQPQVPVFWSHKSSRVWGGAATGLCWKGGGWKWHQLLWLLATPGLSFLFFWTAGISDGWKWKCRSSALTSVCTSWVNTRLATTRHNAGTNCWLQFAMVSSIEPFQLFTTNWPQLRR